VGNSGSAAGTVDPAAPRPRQRSSRPKRSSFGTGTVVQTGDPVVLDDGQRTKSVETDASLRLGEEVTVRGTERDGTIDADDVF